MTYCISRNGTCICKIKTTNTALCYDACLMQEYLKFSSISEEEFQKVRLCKSVSFLNSFVIVYPQPSMCMILVPPIVVRMIPCFVGQLFSIREVCRQRRGGSTSPSSDESRNKACSSGSCKSSTGIAEIEQRNQWSPELGLLRNHPHQTSNVDTLFEKSTEFPTAPQLRRCIQFS